MQDSEPTLDERVAVREPPVRRPVMYQNWERLLFMHWPVAPELLRPHIPQPLSIDTFDGRAWLAITPFAMSGVRPVFLPRVPGLSSPYELNVRTYVYFNRVPGVWFFSLDINSRLAALVARASYYLPYFVADIEVEAGNEDTMRYRLCRRGRGNVPQFKAEWRVGEYVGEARPGSLEFFLVERYCLYAVLGHRLYRARIWHPPWLLRRASLRSLCSTMVTAQHLPQLSGEPLLHYSEKLSVQIYKRTRITENKRSIRR